MATGTGGQGYGGVTGTGGTSNPDAGSCQQKDVPFTPKVPTVFLLVDRGGSDFDTMVQGPNGTTIPLFTAMMNSVEAILPPLQATVRFGFGAFTGDYVDTPQMCPIFSQVPIALNNASAIMTEWASLDSKPTFKPETPEVEVLDMVKTELLADSGNGQKFILYIGNGLTDFCDDQSDISHCAADAVTYKLQQYYTEGIQSLVVGLPSMYSPAFFVQVLQAFANAGVGQPAAIPNATGGPAPANTPADVYNECYNLSSSGPVQYAWRQYYTQAGITGMTSIATYATTGGNAQVFTPTTTNQSDLVTAISAALGNVRSCSFDLSSFQIDASNCMQGSNNPSCALSGAQVYLLDSSGNKTVLPLDPTESNGWFMTDITTTTSATGASVTSATTLQLFGAACTQLRSLNTTDIKFQFPCDLVISIN